MVTLQLRKRGVKTDSYDCSGAKLYHAAANTIRIYILLVILLVKKGYGLVSA